MISWIIFYDDSRGDAGNHLTDQNIVCRQLVVAMSRYPHLAGSGEAFDAVPCCAHTPIIVELDQAVNEKAARIRAARADISAVERSRMRSSTCKAANCCSWKGTPGGKGAMCQ